MRKLKNSRIIRELVIIVMAFLLTELSYFYIQPDRGFHIGTFIFGNNYGSPLSFYYKRQYITDPVPTTYLNFKNLIFDFIFWYLLVMFVWLTIYKLKSKKGKI